LRPRFLVHFGVILGAFIGFRSQPARNYPA
jgi:hypothetical protein